MDVLRLSFWKGTAQQEGPVLVAIFVAALFPRLAAMCTELCASVTMALYMLDGR